MEQEYHGTILSEEGYSTGLKQRLAECIQCYRAFENSGISTMLYIAAWQGSDRRIWYEYVGNGFCALLGCEPRQAAEVFRKSVKDRRIYKDFDTETGVQKEIISRAELGESWQELRQEGITAGTIEAVYRISLDEQNSVWLKDQATIELFEKDDICLSLGILTTVTKEMEAEEKLKEHHDLLESIVAERTAELTRLNKQLQQEIEERTISQEKLQRNLDDIIKAMSRTLEERDPYTAGHQKRTTELSLAIAREMGLPEHKLKGLELAGLIHDMGKISVPSEILSKPGGLNDAEHQLIKRHPQVAYDILNQIDFPWPVDQIVLQHHEKLDGSGYPLGLTGESILLEARILSVADVIETMETHRPYRPSLGREAALREITTHRGTLYDPDVVDTCISLLKDERFKYATGPVELSDQ